MLRSSVLHPDPGRPSTMSRSPLLMIPSNWCRIVLCCFLRKLRCSPSRRGICSQSPMVCCSWSASPVPDTLRSLNATPTRALTMPSLLICPTTFLRKLYRSKDGLDGSSSGLVGVKTPPSPWSPASPATLSGLDWARDMLVARRWSSRCSDSSIMARESWRRRAKVSSSSSAPSPRRRVPAERIGWKPSGPSLSSFESLDEEDRDEACGLSSRSEAGWIASMAECRH